MRLAVGAYIIFSMVLATVCVGFIARTGTGVWEDGSFKEFTGILIHAPYPIIELDSELGPGIGRTALLVDFGKRGAQEKIKGLRPGPVRVTGTTIHREGRALIELSPDADSIVAIESTPGASHAVPSVSRSIKLITLRGEIVDPKCFLGAMKPGEGKTHKACAVRCISGGILPTLVCWDEAGRSTCLVLTDETGNPVKERVLDIVGQPVEISGTLHRLGDLLIMRMSARGPRAL